MLSDCSWRRFVCEQNNFQYVNYNLCTYNSNVEERNTVQYKQYKIGNSQLNFLYYLGLKNSKYNVTLFFTLKWWKRYYYARMRYLEM